MNDRLDQVRALRRRRPRNRFVRASIALFLLMVVGAWFAGSALHAIGGDDRGYVPEFRSGDVRWDERLTRLERFVKEEAAPRPLREGEGLMATAQWAWELFSSGNEHRDSGLRATVTTLAIAVASIVLAGLAGLVLAGPAARNLVTPQPFLPTGRPPAAPARWAWRGVVGVTRGVLIFTRAIPEYVWAFLFLAILGPRAWPAVLALAVHNAGILGKLGAEVVEDVDPDASRAMAGLGATRRHIALGAIFPEVMPRLLLYFFYRWETCVREATVLGMLGFASLGMLIQDARVRFRYDQMLFFVLLGAGLVLMGDLVSAVARRLVRRAG